MEVVGRRPREDLTCDPVQGTGHALLSTAWDGWVSAGPAHHYPAAQEITQLLRLVMLGLPLPVETEHRCGGHK